MKKMTILATLCAGMAFAHSAPAETKLGFTIYRYSDNFMSVVRQVIEKEAAKDDSISLLMNDSQNSQAIQNDQIDMLLASGVKVLAINLVDPIAAPVIINKAKLDNIPVVFFNKEPLARVMASYEQAYYVGTVSKEAGVIQAELIAKHWAANPQWDLNNDGVIQYAMLKGESGHPDAVARSNYVISTLNDMGYKTEQLYFDSARWDTTMAKEKVDTWLSEPDGSKIEVVISNNDAMAIGAVESLKAAGKTAIPVYGVDALEEALAMVRSGQLAGTVLNDAVNQAKATFEIARNLGEGKVAVKGTKWKLVNKSVRLPYVGIDKSNLD